MATVFISYAREDADAAAKLAQALGERGWSVWWDPKIKAGETFDQVIERELDGAGCVVVLWSVRSVASEWVKNEASVAAERGVLIPARLDATKLPLEFRRRQAADLQGWRGDPAHPGFQAICEAIAQLTATPARTIPLGANSRAVDARGNRKWPVAIGVLAACALALGGYAAMRGFALRSPQSASGSASASAPTTASTSAASGATLPTIKAAERGRDAASAAGTTFAAGTFEFAWPGRDCWKAMRGEVVAISSCGAGRHALQAGVYRVQPASSRVFAPFELSIQPGQTTRHDAMAGVLELEWPGRDCWKIYRGDAVAASGCGPGKHALQAGACRIEPASSRAFEPVKFELQRGQTARLGS